MSKSYRSDPRNHIGRTLEIIQDFRGWIKSDTVRGTQDSCIVSTPLTSISQTWVDEIRLSGFDPSFGEFPLCLFPTPDFNGWGAQNFRKCDTISNWKSYRSDPRNHIGRTLEIISARQWISADGFPRMDFRTRHRYSRERAATSCRKLLFSSMNKTPSVRRCASRHSCPSSYFIRKYYVAQQ